MIIICAGPDTYRARKKARALEVGFCVKYDPLARAVERVGIEKTEHVCERLSPLLSAGTLFSTKKFIRADGCLSSAKIAEKKILAEKINKTGADTILVTVEDEAPSKKELDLFHKEAVIVYAFPQLSGKDFQSWVAQEAKQWNISNEIASVIARRTEGDSWLAISEMQKFSANPEQHSGDVLSAIQVESKIFEMTDVLMNKPSGWRARVSAFKDDALGMMYISQLRSLARVQSRHVQGIHPFVQKKMSRVKKVSVSRDFSIVLRAFVSRRKGLAEGNEEETML